MPAIDKYFRILAEAGGSDLHMSAGEPPLMRLTLVRTGPERHRLIWTHHHALLDGWSLPLLMADVFTAYEHGGQGQALPPRRPFVEYLRWLDAQDGAESDAYWDALLADWEHSIPRRRQVERAAG